MSDEPLYTVRLTRLEARAIRLAVIFGAPSDPEPEAITSALAKLQAIEQAAQREEGP